MRISIALKINVIVLLVVLALGGIIGVLFVTEQTALITRELEHRVRFLGEPLSRSISLVASHNDIEAMDRYLQGVALDREVAYILVKST